MLTVKAVASRLKVQPQTAYRWTSAGKLEGIKIEGILRIEEEAYNRFVGKHNRNDDNNTVVE